MRRGPGLGAVNDANRRKGETMAKVKKPKGESRQEPIEGYEITYKIREEFVERQRRGKIVLRIVLRGDERPWDMSRQGRLKWFLNPHLFR